MGSNLKENPDATSMYIYPQKRRKRMSKLTLGGDFHFIMAMLIGFPFHNGTVPPLPNPGGIRFESRSFEHHIFGTCASK